MRSLRRHRPLKLPIGFEITREFLLRQKRAHHLHRDAVLAQNRVVKDAIRQLATVYQFFVQRINLQTPSKYAA